MSKKPLWPVFEMRPIDLTRSWLRYADGQWIDDDGEHDTTFITADNNGAPFCIYVSLPYQKNIVWSGCVGHWSSIGPAKHPDRNPWHYMLRRNAKDWGGDWARDQHENIRAGDAGMNKLCGMRSCANGRHAEWRIGNEFIAAGVVREREPKEVVTFPKRFNCMYCGHVPKLDRKP
jgi:hypothetical protein